MGFFHSTLVLCIAPSVFRSLRLPSAGDLNNAGATLRYQLGAAIDQAAVCLHQACASVDFLGGIRAAQDAADADDRQRALQVLVQGADHGG